MTSMELKEYLRRIYLLEQSLFQQRSFAGQVQRRIRRLENYQGEELRTYHSDKFNFFHFLLTPLMGIAWGGIPGGILCLIIGLFLEGKVIPRGLDAIIVFALKGALVFSILATVASIIMFIKDNKSEKEKERKAAVENDSIRLQNQKNREYAIRQVGVLKQELQILNRSIQQTEQALNRYYGKDIIFPKYRELVAVSSFYEYMASGRCTMLEGHEGAYNIFEMESRQDLILRKLDDIIERLDRIEENQYMLYTAIQNSNRDTNRMLSELNRTAQSIESNSSITAYNSRITAQNTECLKWLAVLQA